MEILQSMTFSFFFKGVDKPNKSLKIQDRKRSHNKPYF